MKEDHVRRYAAKSVSLMLSAALILGGGIARAEEPSFPKEETVYVRLAQDGGVDGIYVVNTYRLEEEADITDHGKYDSVKNLTTGEEIRTRGDTVSFHAAAGQFSYQGNLKRKELPWEISLSYELDGKAMEAGELAGRSGSLKIRIHVGENQKASGDFFEGYMLRLTVPMDMERCGNVRAAGATVENAGMEKRLGYDILSGREKDIVITADVWDFEMGPITFQGHPMSLDVDRDTFSMDDLYDRTEELTDAAQEFDDGAKELSDGTDALREGADGLKEGLESLRDGLKSYADGTRTLSDGVEELSDGTEELADGVDELRDGVNELRDGVNGEDGAASGARKLAEGVDKLEAGAQQLAEGVSALIAMIKGSAAELDKTGRELLMAAGQIAIPGVPGFAADPEKSVHDNLIGLSGYLEGMLRRMIAWGGTGIAEEEKGSSEKADSSGMDKDGEDTVQEDPGEGEETQPDEESGSDEGNGPEDGKEEEEGGDTGDVPGPEDEDGTEDGLDRTDGAGTGDGTSGTEGTSGSGTGEASGAGTESGAISKTGGASGSGKKETSATGDTAGSAEGSSGTGNVSGESEGGGDEPGDMSRTGKGSGSENGLKETVGPVAENEAEEIRSKGEMSGQTAFRYGAVQRTTMETARHYHAPDVPEASERVLFLSDAGGDPGIGLPVQGSGGDAQDVIGQLLGLKAGVDKLLGCYEVMGKFSSPSSLSQLTQLEEGASALSGGISELSQGADSLAEGIRQLGDGISELADGSEELVDGTRDLADGVSDLSDGTRELTDASADLLDGTDQLADGTSELADGARDLQDGVEELKDGTDEFKDNSGEMETRLDEEIDRIVNDLTGSGYSPVSFVSDKNTNVEMVLFSMRTEGIRIPEREAVEGTEAPLSFWQRLLRLFGL